MNGNTAPTVTAPVKRSSSLVRLGWYTFYALYLLQVSLFVAFLITHLDNGWYAFWLILFVPAFWFICSFGSPWSPYANNDEEIQSVWKIWGTYIVAYVITVGTIFGTFAHELTKDDTLGINALLGTLCITPALLILLLQLTICPSYRNHVVSMSIYAALNIFDGIEMLEIFLMQKEANFDLNKETEICIVFFACFCFFLSPFGLVRNKFMNHGVIKARKETSLILSQLEIIGINLPFLVIRAVIWHKYEAAIFIAKNIVALVIGTLEFLILKGTCQCGENSTGEEDETVHDKHIKNEDNIV